MIILLKKRKNQTITKYQTLKNESFFSEDRMISEGSDDEIDENESQREISPRPKQKAIRDKLRNYYKASILEVEVIIKDISELIATKIYNHYKLFNEIMTNSTKK